MHLLLSALIVNGMALGANATAITLPPKEPFADSNSLAAASAGPEKAVVPTQEKTFTGWNLHLCEQTCDVQHSTDRQGLYNHPAVNSIPFEQVTFKMCNFAYVNCNFNCQRQYHQDMLSEPRPGNDWDTFTSSNLTVCVNSCNRVAATDNTLLTEYSPAIINMERDADFAFCFQKISSCVQTCQYHYLEDVRAFQTV